MWRSKCEVRVFTVQFSRGRTLLVEQAWKLLSETSQERQLRHCCVCAIYCVCWKFRHRMKRTSTSKDKPIAG